MKERGPGKALHYPQSDSRTIREPPIQKRFEIGVDKDTFIALNVYARKVNMPVKRIARNILKESIASL